MIYFRILNRLGSFSIVYYRLIMRGVPTEDSVGVVLPSCHEKDDIFFIVFRRRLPFFITLRCSLKQSQGCSGFLKTIKYFERLPYLNLINKREKNPRLLSHQKIIDDRDGQ